MATLHVHLLGDFRLVYAGKLVTTVVQARLQALLAYLLLHRDSPQLRQRMAFLFWPDSAEPQARTNLRQLLHHLRRAWPVAHEFVQTETHTVLWRKDAAYTLDVAEFEGDLVQAVAAAKEGHLAAERMALESAVEHYSGELLPGCYDDWILPERERLHQGFFRALERLTLILEEQREYASTIGHSERLLRHDPLHETTYRRLMRLHALNGDRAGALRVYHACATVLQSELDVEPNADTQEAYQRLLNMQAPAVLIARTPAAAVRPALVGRHDEWNRLGNAWRRASDGKAALLLISGEAGIGKTRLVEEFLQWAAQQGITAARTCSYAVEGRLAYAPLTELLRADPFYTRLFELGDIWLAELAQILPEVVVPRPDLPKPQPITGSWQRRGLFEALARALLSDPGPLILLLDDLQWYDQDTLEWLHYLLHFHAEARLLVIGAVRAEEVDRGHPLAALVLDLRSGEQLREIELGPLDADDTATLAEQIAGRMLAADETSHLYYCTEGNPLFLVETLSQRPGFNTKIPRKVQAIIQYRLEQLTPSARRLARIAATIGREFNAGVLAQASESDEETLVSGLDELWRRRIVREQGVNAYYFSHDRIREVAYSEVSPVRRQALHRRVAAALESVYAQNVDVVSGQIAAHYEQAGMAEKAMAYYLRAAGVAQQSYLDAP
jgi:DNA-binding SARP family transcriptional activator